ncbi:MAG: tetratricopeptide repeat protein [Planctomycetota bacterium]|jgi:tetratricopeptide (TPR) repeat protein|nr:tetratricopeptide repeat protein [Planctomycetota bacterium]
MTRLFTMAIVALGVLGGCGEGHDRYRRGVLPPSADAASLADAQRMDEIERLLDEGDLPGVAAAVDEALAAGLEHPRLYYLRGKMYAARGGDDNLELATQDFERCLGESPRWIQPRIDVADVYMRLDRLSSADSVYQDLDRLAPDYAAGPYGRGYIALMQGREEDARAFLEEALKRQSDHAPSLFTRAALAGQDQDLRMQRQMLERFIALQPSSVGGWRAIAELDEQEGRREDARRAWERAYRLQPEPSIARRLSELARMRGDGVAADEWSRRAGSKAAPPKPDAKGQ